MSDDKNKKDLKKEVEEIEKNENQEKEELEVIKGNGKDLEISEVYDHIKSDKIPGAEKKENIVIPKGSSDKK